MKTIGRHELQQQPPRPVSKQRRWQLRLKAEGKCYLCGASRQGRKSLCPKCMAAKNRIEIARYQRLKAAGLCRRCKGPNACEGQFCETCKPFVAARHAAWRARRKLAAAVA